jgi:hypothetical protein
MGQCRLDTLDAFVKLRQWHKRLGYVDDGSVPCFEPGKVPKHLLDIVSQTEGGLMMTKSYLSRERWEGMEKEADKKGDREDLTREKVKRDEPVPGIPLQLPAFKYSDEEVKLMLEKSTTLATTAQVAK